MNIRIARFMMIVISMLIGWSAQAQNAENQIKNFGLKINGSQIEAGWTAKVSSASEYFELERSADGIHFKSVAYILGPDPGLDGTQFACKDKIKKEETKLYYRLIKVNDGKNVAYSKIKIIKL